MDAFELARAKREKNLERKTRALANKGIDYQPRFDGDVLTDKKDSEKSEVQLGAEASPSVAAGATPAPLVPSPIAPWIAGREGELRISVTFAGARYTFGYLIPGLKGNVQSPERLQALLLAGLKSQFGTRIENVNDLS